MKHRPSIHRIVMVALLTSLAATYSCSKKSKQGTSVNVASGDVPDDILKLEQSAPADWEKVRDQAVLKLVDLASRGDPKRLGFEKPPSRNRLKVLDPIPNALVHVADVKTYEVTNDPAGLVKQDERLTFPVLIDNNRVASSITLTKTANGWTVVSYGEPNTIRAVMKARVRAAHPTNGSLLVAPGKQADYRIVRVTGVNQSFLAAKGPLGMYFIPLFDRPELGFTAGAPKLAKEVLDTLRPLANQHKPFPPPP